MLNLEEFCRIDTDELFNLLGDEWKNDDRHSNRYLYLDRGPDSRVLFVAHLDTVNDFYTPKAGRAVPAYVPADFHVKNNKKYGQYVQSIALDDRLGVWAGLNQLAAYGILCDVLLTLDEEIGASTAKHFKSDKKYNWMFQFDRHNNNPVLYQYDSNDMRDRLESVGYTVSNGTFSDICYLDHLGICGINFGIGYQHEHSSKCYAYISDVGYCIDMFVKFYNQFKDTYMPYVAPPPTVYYRRGHMRGQYDESWEDYTAGDLHCALCGVELIGNEHGYCDPCGKYVDSIDKKHADEFIDDVLNEDSTTMYQGYCDVCSCDLELTEEQAKQDIILCENCAINYQNNLGGQ